MYNNSDRRRKEKQTANDSYLGRTLQADFDHTISMTAVVGDGVVCAEGVWGWVQYWKNTKISLIPAKKGRTGKRFM